MMKIAIGIAAVAVLAGTPALAADMAVKAPPPVAAPAYSWTGFYVGANIGYGWGNRDVTYAPNDLPSLLLMTGVADGLGVFNPTRFTNSGAVGGFQVGYNWQVQRNWLVGLETDFDLSAIMGSGTEAAANINTLPISTLVSEKVDWFGTVRARLGYLPTDNLLAYLTGGFAYGRVAESGNFAIGPGGSFGASFGSIGFNCATASVCFAGSSSNVVPGWTAGAGFEFAVLRNVTVKAEYLYVNLNSSRSLTETALATGIAGLTPSTFTAGFNNTAINIVRAGLNYRF